MAEQDWLLIGILIGVLVGVPVGWLLSQLIGGSSMGVMFERDEAGRIVGIIPIKR